MYNPRRYGSNGVRINAEPRGHPWTKTLDDHVGALNQPPNDLMGIRRFKVQGDTALVSVPRQVGGACSLPSISAVSKRRPYPHVVTVIDRLHLDDVGPQITEILRAHRPRQNPGHVENSNAMKKRMRHVNCPFGALRPP